MQYRNTKFETTRLREDVRKAYQPERTTGRLPFVGTLVCLPDRLKAL